MPIYIILVVIAVYFYPTNANSHSRMDSCRKDIPSVLAALELFYLDTFRYPTNNEGLDVLVDTKGISKAKEVGYLARIPTDQWGNPYQYRIPGTDNRVFDVFSLGRDGKFGGTGLDADYGENSDGYAACRKAAARKYKLVRYKYVATYVLFPVIILCITLFLIFSSIRRILKIPFPMCCRGWSISFPLALFFPLLIFMYMFSKPPWWF